ESDRDADGRAGAPDGADPAALVLGEPVAQQAGAGRVVARLADADGGPAGEKLNEAAGETGEQGGDAPDGDTDADHGLAHAAVAPEAERHGGQGVNEEEGGAQ